MPARPVYYRGSNTAIERVGRRPPAWPLLVSAVLVFALLPLLLAVRC